MTDLSQRETEVMRLVCEGLTAQGIGEVLGISSRTIEIHRRSAVRKLGARNQTHAAVLFDREQAAEARNKVLEEALRELIEQCHDSEKELTEEHYGTHYSGESLPLCNARQALGATHD